jgi:arylsulfatase A-like enzyme
MEDIVLVTIESFRGDYIDATDFISSLDTYSGTSGAHYTRPSLASILSSNFHAALETKIKRPTIAEELSEAGYTTIGLTTSPQADSSFGFASGFDIHDNYVSPTGRNTFLESLAVNIDAVGWVFNRLFPRHKRRSDVPRDDEIIERAIQEFNQADGPRFMWLHIMESHRPYGRGSEAITPALDRKAKYKPKKLTAEEKKRIDTAYRDSLDRVDEWVANMYDALDSNPVFAIAGDHGEGFGEHGYYFHPPQKRRVDDELITVPVAVDGITLADTETEISLLDIAPTLLGTVGINQPDSWHGIDLTSEGRVNTMTVAPWEDHATILLRTPDYTLTARDADVSLSGDGTTTTSEKTAISNEMKKHLQDLGYVDAG